MKFVGRKINAIEETIGEKLQNIREQKKISLKEASEQTGVKQDYLKALEKDEHSSLPAGPYRTTFLKKYSEFLGLDWKKIKKDFKIGVGQKNKSGLSFSPKKIRGRELLIFPKIIKNVLIGIVVSVFFVYIGIYIKISLSPPELIIIEPEENLITSNSSVTVIGKADIKTQITINGRSVLSNESGRFEQLVDLKKGVNVITITAQKKYGPKKIIKKQILVE